MLGIVDAPEGDGWKPQKGSGTPYKHVPNIAREMPKPKHKHKVRHKTQGPVLSSTANAQSL